MQLLSRGGLPRSAKADGGFVSDELSESLTNGTVVKPGIGPHAECEAAAMLEHAVHLHQCGRLIWKKLQSLLTENHVKTDVLELKIERVTLKPFDRSASRYRERPRNADHGGIQIDTNNTSGGTDALCRSASHKACSASNIQHALAFHDASGIDKQRHPRSQDVASDVAFVEFSRLRAKVPWLVLGHLAIHPSLRDIRSAVWVTALICR